MTKDKSISHKSCIGQITERTVEIEKRLEGDDELLALLRDLQKFSLGRFLIANGGLDGFWIDYIIQNHCAQNRTTLECFILEKSPTALATRQRYYIFQEQIKRLMKDDVVVASVPCGMMRCIASLPFANLKNVDIYGVDLDPDALLQAKQMCRRYGCESITKLLNQDAWELNLPKKADLLVSNGLNIYVREDDKAEELYRNFYENIKPGGHLIVSFLTPSSEWYPEAINMKDLELQKKIYVDVLQTNWNSLRSEELTVAQLKRSGFVDIELFPDEANIFPTVVAKRDG